jgi:hypothetical protein
MLLDVSIRTGNQAFQLYGQFYGLITAAVFIGCNLEIEAVLIAPEPIEHSPVIRRQSKETRSDANSGCVTDHLSKA